MPDPRSAVETLLVSPETCSVLGYRVKATDARWRGLDFSRAEIRTQSSALVAMWGRDEAPYDLHLRVPFCHPGGDPEELIYRVRPLMEPGRRWRRRMVADVAIKRDDARDPPWVIEVRYG